MAAPRAPERQTTTIRVSTAARDRLQARATSEDRTVGEVVDAMIRAEEDRAYWEAMRVYVDRLRADPEAWAEYQAESELWETASLVDFAAFIDKFER